MARIVGILVGVVMAACLVACTDASDTAERPRAVDEVPMIDLDGDVPYGPGIEVGASYDYVLYTHCGIEWAPIDGVWWHTDPLNDGNANPPKGWGNPYDGGTLTVGTADLATYTSDTGIDVEFNRTETVDAPFACD